MCTNPVEGKTKNCWTFFDFMVKLPFKNHPHISQVLTSALLFYCTVWRLHKHTLALHFPQGIWALRKLQVLDVAGNKLFMFPVRVCDTLEFSSTRLWHSEIKKKKEIATSLHDAGHSSVQFHLLPLRELHCEGNRFVRCEPMSAVQDAEVLSLKVN